MYIINSKNLTNVRIFSEKIGEWLIEHKIPVLSKNEKGYVFANTRLLKSALENLPSNLKGGAIIE